MTVPLFQESHASILRRCRHGSQSLIVISPLAAARESELAAILIMAEAA
jgi:hypothetical protein